VPWSEIVGHRWQPFGLALERQGADECEVHLVGAWAGRATRSRTDAAWREYVLRKIERDGRLRGTHFMVRPRLQYLAAVILGGLLLAQAAGMIGLSVFSPKGAGEARVSLAVAGVGFLLLATALVTGGLREKRLVNEALLHWYRWEIARDGLVHWPFAERMVLTPSADGSVMSGCGSVGGATVPIGKLTYSRVARALVFAGLDRAGAGRPFLGWLGVSEAALAYLLFWCLLQPMAIAEITVAHLVLGMPEALPVVAFPVASVVAIVASRARSRRRTARAVTDGRAMLERLGW
jgi:hypothetical protein